jgi:hypothetical protein
MLFEHNGVPLSLRNYLMNNFSAIWQRVLSDVQAEYPDVPFPEEWQFSFDIEALLTETFW